MTLLVLAGVSLLLAALPALLYARNILLFRPPSPLSPESQASPPSISVLIPARNEERSIAACVESVLASRAVDLEVLVLDDHSEDRTAEIVREMAHKDSRLRLESAPPLPDDWCGKQHACYALSQYAQRPILCFLDADVRLAPDGLARMALFLDSSKAALVSGFPRQETGTFLEKLIIPLIHFLLLGFLPFRPMRKYLAPGLGAGCGQWFMTRREAYDHVGGHSTVKASLHDGITLPRAYRRAGLMTDCCDATDLATCRMYRSAREVWLGLAKNSREGLGASRLILLTTVLLFGGQVLPFIIVVASLLQAADEWPALVLSGVACLLAYYPRLDAARRFRQSWLGALLHPVGILILLAIQWYSLWMAIIGWPVGWKGRRHPG